MATTLTAALLGGQSAAAAGPAPALQAADPEALGFSKPRLAAFDAAMRRHVADGKYAGITTIVLRHGKIVDFKAVGQQDLKTGKPMQKDTIFRIASMTKPIVGVGLMILYEEGRWQLDDPVAKFIPEFKDLKVLTPSGQLVAPNHPMTMRELLSSTAGISSPPVYEPVLRNPAASKTYEAANLQADSIEQMIGRIAKLPLAYQPGTEFEYGASQDVQGAVIERITGQTLDVFLQQRIFDPLAMKDTGFGVTAGNRDRLAIVYDYDQSGKLRPSPYVSAERAAGVKPAFLSGGGGLYSTAEDYARFATMLLNGGCLGETQILSPPTVKLMTSDLLPKGVQVHFAEKMTGLGYGVNVGIITDPARASYNAGGFGEGTYFWTGVLGSWWWNDPVNDVTVIGLIQQEFAAFAHFGLPTAAPNLRALSGSLIYGALVDPSR